MYATNMIYIIDITMFLLIHKKPDIDYWIPEKDLLPTNFQ